jgi:hypothetical protein
VIEGLSRREHDSHVWPAVSHNGSEFRSFHSGHIAVCEEDGYVGSIPEQTESFTGIRCAEGLEPCSGEDDGGKLTDVSLIIHNYR